MAETNETNIWFIYHRASKKKLGPFAIPILASTLIKNHITLDQILVCKKSVDKWNPPLQDKEFLIAFQPLLQNAKNFLPEISLIEENEIEVESDNSHDTWYFFHKLSKKILGPFTADFLTTLMIDNNFNFQQIFICKPGWKKWSCSQNVTEFKILLDSSNEEDVDLNEFLEEPQQEIESSNNEVIDDENKDWTKFREHPRVTMELKIIFVSGKKSFRTKTIDLSLGGVKTSDPLPEAYLNQELDVFLSSPDLKLSIRFKAELISCKDSLSRLKFTEKNDIGLKHLENWINTVNEKQIKKIA
jgi:hypothetical protein